MTVTKGINIKFNLLGFVIPTERFKSIILIFLYNSTYNTPLLMMEHLDDLILKLMAMLQKCIDIYVKQHHIIVIIAKQSH